MSPISRTPSEAQGYSPRPPRGSRDGHADASVSPAVSQRHGCRGRGVADAGVSPRTLRVRDRVPCRMVAPPSSDRSYLLARGGQQRTFASTFALDPCMVADVLAVRHLAAARVPGEG